MTRQIVRTTTGTRFEGYHKKECNNLEYHTSIFNKNAYKRVETTGFCDSTNETFLTYKMSNEALRYMTAGSKFVDAPVVNTPVQTGLDLAPMESLINLTDIQIPVMNKMTYCSGPEMFVNLPTAVGKTVLGVHYMSFYNKKTIIFCFRRKVLDQWYQTLISRTTINEKRIQIVSGSKYLERVLDGDIDTSKTDVWLVTPALILTFCNANGWDKLPKLFELMGIGLKIFDEAHRNIGTTVKVNAWTSIAKTIYLSADFNQASYEVRTQFFKIFENVPIIKLSQDVIDTLKHITAVEYIFDSHPSIDETLKITHGNKANKYHWDHFGYTKYEKSKGILSEHVIAIVNQIIASEQNIKCNGKPYKILILTNMIDSVDAMYDLLRASGIDRSVGRCHGNVPKEELLEVPDKDIIVSTYLAYSTGVDVTMPNFRHVISMCPVDYITANQAAGRNRPIEGMQSYFWMLVDKGFDFCMSNGTKVLKYLSQSRIGEIKRIEI